MTGVVIRCAGVAGTLLNSARQPDPTGLFLRKYLPEARDGHGEVTWTNQARKALVFPDAVEAFKAWRTVPVTRPVRADGQPNRPMTCFTIQIEPAPEAAL